MNKPTIKLEEDLEEYMEAHNLDEYDVLVELEPDYKSSSVDVEVTMWAVDTEPRQGEYVLHAPEELEPREVYEIWVRDVKQENRDFDWV